VLLYPEDAVAPFLCLIHEINYAGNAFFVQKNPPFPVPATCMAVKNAPQFPEQISCKKAKVF
jgi:hypothetical protein